MSEIAIKMQSKVRRMAIIGIMLFMIVGGSGCSMNKKITAEEQLISALGKI